MREDCIFKTNKYANGCNALDERIVDCKTCSFYKNQEMQQESLRIAEERMQVRIRNKMSRHMEAWTDEEEEYILAHMDDSPAKVAAAIGRSEWAIAAKRRRLRNEGRQ